MIRTSKQAVAGIGGAALALALSARPAPALTYQGNDILTLPSSFTLSAYQQPVGGGQAVGQKGSNAWLITTSGGINLNPTGYSNSYICGTNGVQQVGYGSNHALLWSGSAGTAVDLHPTGLGGFTYSWAITVNASYEVGYGGKGGQVHALLWHGTAASAVDLHPTNLAGFTQSIALGVDGGKEVGWGTPASGGWAHALMWSGTAASTVDLHPTDLSFRDSGIQWICGGQEVGWGSNSTTMYDTTSSAHALLWTGSAATVVDLNPTDLVGYTYSVGWETNGYEQVGWGHTTGGKDHALLWRGTADSAIDLQALLPGTWTSSRAISIDAGGDIYGTALDTSGNTHMVEWIAVPEPASLTLLAAGLVLLSRRRGARR